MFAKEKSVKKNWHIGRVSHLKFVWLRIILLEIKLLSNHIGIFNVYINLILIYFDNLKFFLFFKLIVINVYTNYL